MASFFMFSLITILLSFQPSEAKNAADVSINDQLFQTYIVQLRAPDHLARLMSEERESWYASVLSQIVSHDEKSSRLVQSYRHVFHGFAARLTLDEFEALQQLEEVVSAWPDTVYHPETTHSPDFLGLNTSVGGLWEKSEYGSGIIIGQLDTGINPDGHLSFQGTGPPPEAWSGKCQAPIRCNSKLIGAKSLVGGTPEDFKGHGSHVAGILVGARVSGASAGGEGYGVASGIAPGSQLAIYKVCARGSGCGGHAMLAAFDAAIEDGVDIISMSIGPPGGGRQFHSDSTAIGAFAAIRRGIFVSASAGNEGPSPSSLTNEAPWYLTVGSSNTDRIITSRYGNGIIRSVLEAEDDIVGSLHRTSYNNLLAPIIARGSSRGPPRVAKGMIKPDIIGPGVQIIAAGRTGVETFVTKSGTSIACPHLSASAALIKKMHPDWSPGAIKSALMTTAYQNNLSNRPIIEESTNRSATPYDMGAGHVDVTRAIDPGLVFDVQPDDYISYLCSIGYTSRQVSVVSASTVTCSRVTKPSGSWLNLPSIYVDLRAQESVTVPRTVTNVGSHADEVYQMEIEYVVPGKFLISVDPQNLQFSDLNIKKTYNITFTRQASQETGTFEASMVWRSDMHVVRSPVMVDL